MRINSISGFGATKKSNQSFKSKIINEKSQTPLPREVKDFIDKFEDSCPKNEKGERKITSIFANKDFRVSERQNGESAYTYFIKQDGFSYPDFVIKELKPLKYKKRSEFGLGSLSHEYDMAKQAHDIQQERVQNPIAYVKTQNGSMFYLSEVMPNIENFGNLTSQIFTAPAGRRMNETYLRSAFETLAKFDKHKLFHSDLTQSNVSIGKKDDMANFLDFQWSEDITGRSKRYIQTFTFEPSENVNNIAPFEANVVADYLIGMLGKDSINDINNNDGGKVDRARQVLRDYLKIRADYEPRTYKFSNDVFKNPSDDILDAELLRLAILRNHRLQFLYTDDNIEKPRNMMKLVGYSAMANFAAKQLANFSPQKPPRNEREREYFQYMREYGNFWHNNTKEWYKTTSLYLRNLAMGTERAPGRYYEALFRPAGLDSDISHFTLFDKNSTIFEKNKRGLRNLRNDVNQLEYALDDIKKGEYISKEEFLEYTEDVFN